MVAWDEHLVSQAVRAVWADGPQSWCRRATKSTGSVTGIRAQGDRLNSGWDAQLGSRAVHAVWADGPQSRRVQAPTMRWKLATGMRGLARDCTSLSVLSACCWAPPIYLAHAILLVQSTFPVQAIQIAPFLQHTLSPRSLKPAHTSLRTGTK